MKHHQPLLDGLAALGLPQGSPMALPLAIRYRTPEAMRSFTGALSAFEGLELPAEQLVGVLACHVDSVEQGLAAMALGRLLAQRGLRGFPLDALSELLAVLPTRAAARRYAAVLALFDQHGLAGDELSPLTAAFAGPAALPWLGRALAELQAHGRRVDKPRLARLWASAPDEAALSRYAGGVTALVEAGLDEASADALLLPLVGDPHAYRTLLQLADGSLAPPSEPPGPGRLTLLRERHAAPERRSAPA